MTYIRFRNEIILSYKVLAENGLILSNFQDKVRIKDLKNITLKFMEEPFYNPDYNLLMDFRDSLAIAFRMELSDYLDFFKKSVRLTRNAIVAILFASPNQEFLIKVYKPMAKLFKMKVERFKEVNDALIWIGVPFDNFDLIYSHLKEIKYQTIQQQ